MTHLLDVNALIAALWVPHQHHARFRIWAQTRPGDFATCALTELGYLRVINAVYGVSISAAKQQLRALHTSPSVTFSSDTESPVALLPALVANHDDTTDGYLCALARKEGAKLATFDTAISDPAAYLVPPFLFLRFLCFLWPTLCGIKHEALRTQPRLPRGAGLLHPPSLAPAAGAALGCHRLRPRRV